MTVNYVEYAKKKMSFFEKHDYNFKTDTSCLDQYDGYHKEYIFEDGAIWYEVMSIEHVTETVEIKMARVDVTVKMLRTEFWNSDDAHSFYYYEKY